MKHYITSKRIYKDISNNNKDKVNKYEFSDNKDISIENYCDEYNKIMILLGDFNFFKNLFRLKFLSKGIRAYVDSNLKIIINSLYFEFNKDFEQDNKRVILKAVLKILIINEIMHILNYMKKDVNFAHIPKKPRGIEEGEMLINYLFGLPIINRIYLDEAIKINDIKNWESIEKLKSIFNFKEIQSEKTENNIDLKVKKRFYDHINLYFTRESINIEEEEEEKEKEFYTENDSDIDIN